jgi:ADP-heptose:LPS heptosyltransferase
MNSEPDWFNTDPEQSVSELLTEFQASGAYTRDRLTRLVQLAVSEDQQIAAGASRAFFTSLVETLADSFEPAAVSFYNKAFAQLIQSCRNTDRARPLDQRLNESGLLTEADVLARAERLRPGSLERASRHLPDATEVSRVIVLSRVTLGADVAITSLMIERFKAAFPQAEIVLVGGRKASELFGGDPRLAFEEIDYPRAATALDRLLAWVPLIDRVCELTAGVDRCLIVDPDSRLSQLGLLPLSRENARNADEAAIRARYLFFPSREYHHDSSSSLSELASTWLDEVLGSAPPSYPTVSLRPDDLEAGRALIERIKRASHPIITINFGVGGNESKRVGENFERQLVGGLLQSGATVVLDKGAGAEEAERARAVVEFARRSNERLRVIDVDEGGLAGVLSADRIDAELMVWSGRVGLLAALIGGSDLYIGYDSAGQHIAAALGVPSIDVFAGFSSRRMLDRWRPGGRAEPRVIAVEQSMIGDAVLAEALGQADELLKRTA